MSSKVSLLTGEIFSLKGGSLNVISNKIVWDVIVKEAYDNVDEIFDGTKRANEHLYLPALDILPEVTQYSEEFFKTVFKTLEVNDAHDSEKND